MPLQAHRLWNQVHINRDDFKERNQFTHQLFIHLRTIADLFRKEHAQSRARCESDLTLVMITRKGERRHQNQACLSTIPPFPVIITLKSVRNLSCSRSVITRGMARASTCRHDPLKMWRSQAPTARPQASSMGSTMVPKFRPHHHAR